MGRAGLVALFVCAAFVGCNKPQSEAPAPPPAPVAPAPVASAAPAPSAAIAASGKMGHCPSSVVGASSVVDDAPTGVLVTVTSTDPAATAEIRARAAFLASSSTNDTTPITHNGTGEGGGVFGRCPIVMRDTKIQVADTEGGSKLTVTPRDWREKDWLRRESRGRLAELGAPGGAGAGAGKMAHCPNAVKGASTSISDKTDAVSITVTAKSDDAVKQIRDRAKEIVAAAAKVDGAKVSHDGTGSGGGGFGRCPIVLKDTAVDEKDTAGGATFTVKPKDAKDLPALKQQVRDRSAKFN
jgi:hypothetical protein